MLFNIWREIRYISVELKKYSVLLLLRVCTKKKKVALIHGLQFGKTQQFHS